LLAKEITATNNLGLYPAVRFSLMAGEAGQTEKEVKSEKMAI